MTDHSSPSRRSVLAATCVLAATVALGSGPLAASDAMHARPDRARCPAVGPCAAFPHRLVIPANALARTAGIEASERGLLWNERNGYVALTVPRPLDYGGGPVRVVVFHYLTGAGEGTVQFGMTPVDLAPGHGFETYGGNATRALPANSETHYEQWAVLAPEDGAFSGSGPWWHVEISRNGTYEGPLQLITVLVEYR